jgi:hypothetical protein
MSSKFRGKEAMTMLELAICALLTCHSKGQQHDEPGTIVLDRRGFVMPLRIEPQFAARLRECNLFVSEDRGKTWRLFSTVPAGRREFLCKVAKDGVYWFALQTVAKDGTESPQSKGLFPMMKVRVSSRQEPQPKDQDDQENVLDWREEVKVIREEVQLLRRWLDHMERRLARLEPKIKQP